MKPRIAFVGVGRMGANMARHLKDSGYNVTAVYDKTATLANELARELGCASPASLASVTKEADVILTVVTDDQAMRDIFFAEDSLLKNAQGKTFINCATITPSVHVDVEKAANAAGAESLEACMASSITQARNGTLYLMIGGKENIYLENKALLETLSSALRYIGHSGQAAQVKALVNMVMNINTAALAEGLGLADVLGLDLDIVREVFSQTGANSRVLETDGGDMVVRDHDCYFSAAHAAKDSGIANGLAKEAGLTLPLSTITEAQYRKMEAMGLGDLDKSGIAELTFKGRALHGGE